MESRDQDSAGMQSLGICDESKCVSQGAWNHISDDTSKPFMNPFTCYGDEGIFYPRMCADGFLPVVVEDEPTLSSADWYGNLDANITVSYFTCCPPTAAPTVNAERHCSDPNVGRADHASDDASCGARDTRIIPRQMTTNVMTDWLAGSVATRRYSSTEIDSYLCCDPIPTVDSKNDEPEDGDFLNDTECVPYRSESYDGFLKENQLGDIVPISCDFPDGSFTVPRPSPTGRYRCCKNGTAMPPFVHDHAFNITVYPLLTLWGVSAILSAIGVLSLLIPLVKQLKTRNTNTRLSQTIGEARFSTYNLYLVYLMLLDLIFAVVNIGWCSSYINQNDHPGFDGLLVRKRSILEVDYRGLRDLSIGWTYLIGNFYINCFILHQVVFFLKTFRSGQRIKPPSLSRVNLQGGGVFALLLVYGSIFFFLLDDSRTHYQIAVGLWQVLAYPAFIYNLWVYVRIWWLGYMPSVKVRDSKTVDYRSSTTIAVTGRSSATWRSSNTSAMNSVRDKAIRELALYFLRVVFVFIGIWLPGCMISYMCANNRAWFATNCFYAIQPIVTFCFIVTKSDVRGYILDLVRCSTCRTTETHTRSSTITPKESKAHAPRVDTSYMLSDTRIGGNRIGGESAASADSHEDPERGRETKHQYNESTCFFMNVSGELAQGSAPLPKDSTADIVPLESMTSLDESNKSTYIDFREQELNIIHPKLENEDENLPIENHEEKMENQDDVEHARRPGLSPTSIDTTECTTSIDESDETCF